MREEIHRHMDITEDLTDKVQGSNKSFLAAANEPNKTCESSNTSATTTSMRPDLEYSNSSELNSSQSESAKAADDPENEERESHTPVSIQEEIVGDFKSEKSRRELSESPGAGKGASGSTRIITRLWNPDSKLSQLKSQQVAAAAHEGSKLFKEDKEMASNHAPVMLRLIIGSGCNTKI
ncbi:PREDICTED: nucleosome-remodeling factor subunit BPTF-like [Cercocebus atys]|uniref:nucleosome-remodeling factor subunit BPTF-like n=1 Tax=Cercocebus atys TaxID=9531 RepID=UPI0005F566E6|nr:PREDICTED: nucleosome-remodeling factor subunit BPTF-like [Cercocebus atys]